MKKKKNIIRAKFGAILGVCLSLMSKVKLRQISKTSVTKTKRNKLKWFLVQHNRIRMILSTN